MKLVKSLNHLNHYFNEFPYGGLKKYDECDQALIYQLFTNGGKREDQFFYLKFNYVEFMHIPLSLDLASIRSQRIPFWSYNLNELRISTKEEMNNFLPDNVSQYISNNQSNYKCYRFYAHKIATEFYVYCLNIEGWISTEGNPNEFVIPRNPN